MKKTAVLFVLTLAFASCDKIDKPNLKPPPPACILNAPIVKTNTGNNTTRRVLVEDYTGHTCGYCPRAARRAESIVATYGDKVVVIANHVSGQFAKPESDTLYREDFRNPTSDEWDAFFGMSKAGLPRGGVNRVEPYAQPDASWPSLVSNALALPQSARLDITTNYDPTQRLLNVKVKTTFLATYTTNIVLSLILTQDSIVGDQKDYVPPPGVIIEAPDVRPDYLFEHIVIGAANGTWGQRLKFTPAVNDTVTVNSDCYLLGKCYFKQLVCVDDKHVNLVAFVYREDTKEVLQVEKIKIR